MVIQIGDRSRDSLGERPDDGLDGIFLEREKGNKYHHNGNLFPWALTTVLRVLLIAWTLSLELSA
jgi:hypothetical protein